MKVSLVVIGVLLYPFSLFAQVHNPTWKLIDDRKMSTFDMLTTRTGLVAIADDVQSSWIIARYLNGSVDGIYAANGNVTSMIIRDADAAYVSVRGDGVYLSSNKWKNYERILDDPNATVLAVRGSDIFVNKGRNLYYSKDGRTFQASNGIDPTDSITALEIFSTQTSVAVTGTSVYRTTNGGKDWNFVIDKLERTNSVYVDRTHKSIYIGGSKLFKSYDSGASWQILSSIFFTLSGPVIGSRDCSGTLYIGPDSATHGEIYRSGDQGRFFQEAGQAIFSSTRLRKGVVLDRGSTFFWLDKSGFLGVVRDGIDSVVTDSVRDRVVIEIDTGIRNSLCNNAPPTAFTSRISFDQCTGISLDSLKLVNPAPAFITAFAKTFLGDSTVRVSFTFRAKHPGYDTAHYRLRFTSPTTGNVEQKFFDVIGFGTIGSPELNFSNPELNFPNTGLDSTNKLTLTLMNPGCDTLVIDSILSTNPAVFLLQVKQYPIKIAPSKSAPLTISFNPHLEGDYLESLQLNTDIGTKYVALRGIGNRGGTGAVLNRQATQPIRIFPNPAKSAVTISSTLPLPSEITIYDLLGNEMRKLDTEMALTTTVDINALTEGCYILSFGRGNYKRMIVQH